MKERFGIEMTKDHASVCKGVILRREAKNKKATQAKPAVAKSGVIKAEPKPSIHTSAASAAPTRAGTQKRGIQLEDIQAVKGLLARVGADQLHSLIDLLVK